MLFFIRIIFFFNQRVWVCRIKIVQRIFYIDLELILNLWRFLFLIIVWVIRTRVLFFSCAYIRSYSIQNFLLLYVRFIFSIVWLILNNNFYWIILGWDGLGVVSFLLIVYYINYESVNNGLFTLFQNRLGDLFFVLFILSILNRNIWINLSYISIRCILCIGAVVKRAQFPFNSWLLAAIRAPTPISSLVHSSTLVVAGVYILLQFSYCLCEYLYILKYISLCTLFIRRFGLLNESDIKKLIAYSTISHVGLIIFLYRHQLYKIVYFHLNIHAIFKSFIFICFGFVMLISFHRQDKRLVRLVNLNPIIKLLYYYSCFCMSGLPFLRAFFSKDFIIEKLIEISGEMREIFFLIIFLRLRIYYRIKLLNLIINMNAYNIVFDYYLGSLGLVLILIISILIVNLYIALIFSVRLEIVNFKFIIYLFIIIIIFLAFLTNLNFKWYSYDKNKNFKEIWLVNYYSLDQYIYWNMLNVWKIVAAISNVKLFLLINWWFIIIVIVVF